MRVFRKGAPPDDDRALVTLARRGDQDAARALFDRYFDRIYNYAYARLGRVEDAEDLAIETMTRSLTRLELFREQGVSFSAWVYRIAHNATIDHYRRQARTPTVSLEEAGSRLPDSEDPAGLAIEHVSNDDLRRALRVLTEDQQQVLILRFFEDQAADQVAHVMGKSTGAIQALQHRALASLERELAREARV